MTKRFVIHSLTYVFLSATLATAQMGTGRVSGTLKDASGNSIEGGTVTAVPSGSGRTLETTTDKNGKWALLGFRNGSYEFTFAAQGFQTRTYTAPMRQISQNPPMDVELEQEQTGQAAAGSSSLLGEANDLAKAGSYPEALALYDKLLADQPSLYQINLNIASVYREMGDLDKALEYYAIVLEYEPQHSGALVSTGDILVTQGKLEEAVGYFEKAIGQTADPVIPFNVAEIYFNEGKATEAIEFYKKAAVLKPDWPEPHLKLAYAYLNTGDMDAAAASFEKVVEIAPDSPLAQAAQQALESLKKD